MRKYEQCRTKMCDSLYERRKKGVCKFTKARWVKVRDFAQEWLKVKCFEGVEKEISESVLRRPSVDILHDGYHPSCYCRFTHRLRLSRIKNKQKSMKKQLTPSKVRLRSLKERSQPASTILPSVCVICHLKSKTRRRSGLSRCQEPLVQVN